MVGENQYKDKDEFQSQSIFFVVKGDLYEGKDGHRRSLTKLKRQTKSATRVVPRLIRPY